MNRRDFLKLFAAAGPVAAVAPTYFFAPGGGWHSDVIVFPARPDMAGDVLAAQRFISIDYGKENSYAVYWLARDGRILAFDGSEVQPMHAEWSTHTWE